jgi:moderate conductance mechanosensitive channel
MPQLLRDIVVVDTKYIIPAIHIVVTIILGYIVLRLIDSALSRLKFVIPQSEMLGGIPPRIEQRAETLRSVLRSVVKGILILLVLIQIGWELNYSFYPLLASAGIVGLAVGFGAQSLVKDVISGFFILFEDQFGVGDVVKIGDFSGVVEKMTLRATVLRNLEGQVYVVPNGNIQHVIVTTKEWARAVLDVTVRHEEPLGKVFDVLQRVGNRLAEDMPGRVLEKPTILGVEKLDDSGVTIRSIVKTPPFKNADVLREWRRRIIEEFDRIGIRFVQKEGIVGRPS